MLCSSNVLFEIGHRNRLKLVASHLFTISYFVHGEMRLIRFVFIISFRMLILIQIYVLSRRLCVTAQQCLSYQSIPIADVLRYYIKRTLKVSVRLMECSSVAKNYFLLMYRTYHFVCFISRYISINGFNELVHA